MAKQTIIALAMAYHEVLNVNYSWFIAQSCIQERLKLRDLKISFHWLDGVLKLSMTRLKIPNFEYIIRSDYEYSMSFI